MQSLAAILKISILAFSRRRRTELRETIRTSGPYEREETRGDVNSADIDSIDGKFGGRDSCHTRAYVFVFSITRIRLTKINYSL